MSTVKSITLSHSSAGYDSYEKLNQIFVKGNKERAESYIKNLTKEYIQRHHLQIAFQSGG